MNAIRWALLALALCSAPAAAAEGPKEVVVTGEAAIDDGDVPAAKQRARDAALREAVQQVAGAHVTSFSEMADYTLVRDIVFAQTAGYVLGYELVSEKVDEEAELVAASYRVKVAQGAIDRDAAAVAALLSLKQQKRLYIVVEHNEVGIAGGTAVTVRDGQFANELRNVFRKDGFTILEPNLADGKLESGPAVQAISTPRKAAEVGQVLGADVIIYGQATSTTTTTETYGAKSISSTVRVALSAVSPSSAEVIAETNHSLVRSATDEAQAKALATKAAAGAASKAIRAGLYEAWRRQIGGTQSVMLEVAGVADFAAYKALKGQLETNLRAVKSVSSSRLDKGRAYYQLEVAGTADQAASELAGLVVAGKGLKVIGVQPSAIQAERQ
ncbi:MAG: flagellar assembly protein T N-terminal domain-containing protein [Myxococcales bacterium]